MYILEVSYGCPSEKYPINGIFQFDQAKALANYGHKVVFAAVDMRSIRRRRHWGVLIHKKENIDVYEFNFPMGPILRKLRVIIARRGFSHLLNRIIQKHGVPDIVHAHFANTAMCVIDACKKAGIPYVVTEHASWVNRDDISREYAKKLKYVYENAAKVIAVSKALADRILRHTGVVADVIPNVVDVAELTYDSKIARAPGFTYLSAGTLKSLKGFDVLLSAFRKVNTIHPDSRLIIMGDGPVQKSLQAQTNTLDIHDKVEFFGAYTRNEFAYKLNSSDVFVLASRSETFGIVYIEAMACGLPVIATNCGGPEDFVTLENGVLVEINDIDGLAEAMDYMYCNTKKYNSELIREKVLEQFSPDSIAKRLSIVFDNILSEGLV